MGGFYERMVQRVKVPLKKILGKSLLDVEELTTVLTEIEAQVNSRPLGYVSDDPNDYKVITPAHLLLGRSLHSLPDPPKDGERDDGVIKKWRHRQRLATHFWSRWSKEYLVTLSQYRKWLNKKTNLQVGDVVLVSEEKTPRGTWPLGRVVATYPGQDGLVRAVDVKTQRAVLRRPIHKLHVLETSV